MSRVVKIITAFGLVREEGGRVRLREVVARQFVNERLRSRVPNRTESKQPIGSYNFPFIQLCIYIKPSALLVSIGYSTVV